MNKTTCQNCKKEFDILSEDADFYKKIEVPEPTFCPECREQRRIAWRNERSLYKRKCDMCGKETVSRISPDKPYPMYCKACWWSDNWDPLDYGREYDFSKPFFRQFKELLYSVPHVSLFTANMVNSDWTNQETDDKNCYLNVGGHYNEDSAYNTYQFRGKDCFDNFWSLESQLCYENINCDRCYKTVFSRECFDCQDTAFSFDCKNCSYVIGCAGLRSEKYWIFNKKVTEEEYKTFLRDNPFSSRKKVEELTEQSRSVWNSRPRRFALILKSVDATGNFIVNSKNAHNMWNAEETQNCKNFYFCGWLKDSYDGSSMGWGELCYEVGHSVGLSDCKNTMYSAGGTAESMQSYHLEYCIGTGSSTNCFGCVNLRNKQYCILNRQYTKEEYEKLVPRIKKHMDEMPYEDQRGRAYKYGEFFPMEISLYGYNETVAMDYYPLSKEDALKKGYPWSNFEPERRHETSDYDIPDDIKDVKDDILEKILKCEISGKPYRLIPMELSFYRRMNLPVPRVSPLERHKRRMEKLPPRRFSTRTCQCAGTQSEDNGRVYSNTASHKHGSGHCPNTFETPFEQGREEIVYCEDCYQAETS